MEIDKQKDYLINELGKALCDLDIRVHKRFICINGRKILGYRALAMMLWPNEFIDGKRKIVHHIDGDRSNNCASNLVVLTYKEHKLIHKLFDPEKYNMTCTLMSNAAIANNKKRRGIKYKTRKDKGTKRVKPYKPHKPYSYKGPRKSRSDKGISRGPQGPNKSKGLKRKPHSKEWNKAISAGLKKYYDEQR